MARLWWTTLPDKYYMKSTSRGGRNEILFALLGKFKLVILLYPKLHF